MSPGGDILDIFDLTILPFTSPLFPLNPMSTSNPLKRLWKKNASSSSIVVVVQKNKDDNPQNLAVSDKAVHVNPDILQEAWAAVRHISSDAQEPEGELSRAGGSVVYYTTQDFLTHLQISSMRIAKSFPTNSGTEDRAPT